MADREQNPQGAQNNDTGAKKSENNIELLESVDRVAVDHHEALSPSSTIPAWKSLNQVDGDTALALFDNAEQLNEIVDPAEERRLVRKIDMLILPCLIVCYTFYYVSICLSYDLTCGCY